MTLTNCTWLKLQVWKAVSFVCLFLLFVNQKPHGGLLLRQRSTYTKCSSSTFNVNQKEQMLLLEIPIIVLNFGI